MKRYRLWEDPMTALTRAAHHEMKEFPDGDWVRQEDVEALQALNAEMLEALEEIANTDINGAGDAVVKYIFIAKQHLAKTIVTKAKGEQP